MKKLILIPILLLLVACGGTEPEATGSSSQIGSSALTAEYENALSVPAQLAFGTIQLEETETAVSEEQAAELLPLWQALSALTTSGTAADLELQAVYGQIEQVMSDEQLDAIAELELTTEAMATLGFGGGRPGGQGNNGEGRGAGNGAPGGGPPGGGQGFGGGRPGGGGDLGNIDPSDLATRQAERFGGANPQEAIAQQAVVRYLMQKTGVAPANPNGGDNRDGRLLNQVSEITGIDMNVLRERMAAGDTVAEIITAEGGDVAAVETALLEMLTELDQSGDRDIEAVITSFLYGSE